MKKISEAIQEVLYRDEIALESLRRGLLNGSAYAREIKTQVEELTFKDVDYKTIAAELPRLVQSMNTTITLPKIELSSISLYSNLAEIAYEKTEQVLAKIKQLYLELGAESKGFLTMTEGLTEVAVIAEQTIAKKFKNVLLDTPPVYFNDDLVGVSVKFDLRYIEIPQQIVQLVKRLTIKNINLIEVVSTPTEMTFLVESKDAQLALQQLSGR